MQRFGDEGTRCQFMAQGGVVLGPVDIADRGNSFGVTEHELAALATEHAQHIYPNDRPDTAFAKLFSGNDADGVTLRRALGVAKAMPIAADLTPMMVGGVAATHDAIDNTESSEAYAQLEAMAARLRGTSPWLSSAQAFSAVIQEPADIALARKAHQRPTAPAGGVYPFPR
jgi:hypothetical protein